MHLSIGKISKYYILVFCVELLEFEHPRRENLSLFQRDGVVKRSTNASDGSVSLQTDHVALGGSFDKVLLQFLASSGSSNSEAHVHDTAIAFVDGAVIESVGVVDDAVDKTALLQVQLVDRLQTALCFNPLKHEVCRVDTESNGLFGSKGNGYTLRSAECYTDYCWQSSLYN